MSSRKSKLEFRSGVTDSLGYYVYRLVDPDNGQTFYVGKGTGNRVFDHLNEARSLKRETPKLQKVRSIWEKGMEVDIIIHRHALTEHEALLVEASLIDMLPEVMTDYGNRGNAVLGHGSRSLGAQGLTSINHRYAAEPATITTPMALIKINRRWLDHWKKNGRSPSDGEIFEMVRGDWAVKPSRHPKVQMVAATAFGIIRQVFAVSAWSTQDTNGRVSFEGSVCPEHSDLIGTHVNEVFSPGAQNPVRWYYPKANP